MEQNNNIIPNFPFVSIDSRKLIEKYRWVLISVPVVLLVAAGGGAAYWYVHRPNQNVEQAKAADNRVYSSTQATTKLLSSNNKFGQAASLWTTYAARTPDKSHKDAAYLDAAALYLSGGQYAEAVSMCQKAENVEGITFDEADIAANAYMSLGNKPKAIYYYQQAIRLIPAKISDRGSEIMSFNQAIQELQASS